jgi:hypothetical protein
MIVCDAHVHLYRQFHLERLLASARDNFFTQCRDCWSPPPTMVLFLADTPRAEGFAALSALAESGGVVGKFQLRQTAEKDSLIALDPEHRGERLILIAGRQLVTAEKIEVLSLASPAIIEDGLELTRTVTEIHKRGGLAVLPWGVGKWLGKRGAILGNYLRQADPCGLFVGDNGGRPNLWPASQLFEVAAGRGIRLLPGSDPLPLPGEEKHVGSYGFCCQGTCGEEHPARDLRLLLTAAKNFVSFGANTNLFSFFRTQIALRLTK